MDTLRGVIENIVGFFKGKNKLLDEYYDDYNFTMSKKLFYILSLCVWILIFLLFVISFFIVYNLLEPK
ncbi:hypothetical protein ERUR111494_03630 [Erysipelothrix urinaevulpis]|uniref:hypothetical protein n=1 Tax=Erysipelothrix urinaevulpis TaxID=2683717 RepID=UPI00135C4ABC|nr:hypothetical protein [Erysipelothrix urinaevulpis]